MKIREVMTSPAIRIHPEEPVSVAARTLAQYNIGALVVCSGDGKPCGVVTDRDLVTRCIAAGRAPGQTPVRDVMTGSVLAVQPDMEVSAAAHLMGARQIRRLPVLENGRLCGVVSIGDLAAREDCAFDATDALSEIAQNISER